MGIVADDHCPLTSKVPSPKQQQQQLHSLHFIDNSYDIGPVQRFVYHKDYVLFHLTDQKVGHKSETPNFSFKAKWHELLVITKQQQHNKKHCSTQADKSPSFKFMPIVDKVKKTNKQTNNNKNRNNF